MNAKIPVVNEQDEVIGYRIRKELQSGDIFRVTGLWIYDAVTSKRINLIYIGKYCVWNFTTTIFHEGP
jgi:hypothetical protein